MPIPEAEVTALLKLLPEDSFLSKYVQYADKITDANTSFHVGAALSLLAATAPLTLKAKNAGTVRPSVFVLLHGPSTESRKTSCIRIPRELLESVNTSLLCPEPGSSEGLIESIRAQRTQLLTYEEFGAFMARAESGYMRTMKTMFNQLVDASPLSRQLAKDKGKPAEVIRDYNVSILAGIAPHLLEEHAEMADWMGGFLGRFLILDGLRERYKAKAGSDPVGEEMLREILKAKMLVRNMGVCQGLTALADDVWAKFGDDVEALKADVPEVAKVAISRSMQIAMKVAILLAWDYGDASHGGEWYITDEDLIPAIAIAKMHMTSAITIAQALAIDRDMKARRKLLSLVPKENGVTFGYLLREGQMIKGRGKQILETLLEEGSIQGTTAQAGVRQLFTRTLALPSELASDKEITDLIGTGRAKATLLARRQLAAANNSVGGNVIQFPGVNGTTSFTHIQGISDNALIGVSDEPKTKLYDATGRLIEAQISHTNLGPNGEPAFNPTAPVI